MKEDEIDISFINIMKKLDNQLNKLKKEKEEAFYLTDYDLAEDIIEKEKKINLLKDKIKELRNEYNSIFNNKIEKNKIRQSLENKVNENNIIKGKRTREEEFYIPILESLIEFGGRAESKAIISSVYEKIKGKLNDYDYVPLSKSKEIRWQNTTRWARKYLIDIGFLKADSPIGIWEISEKGVEFYNKQKR